MRQNRIKRKNQLILVIGGFIYGARSAVMLTNVAVSLVVLKFHSAHIAEEFFLIIRKKNESQYDFKLCDCFLSEFAV